MKKKFILPALLVAVILIYACNFISWIHSPALAAVPGKLLPEEALKTLVLPNDTAIQYTGRIDFSDPLKPSFSYPGVSIKAKFEGTFIDLIMRDYNTGLTYLGEPDNDYYNILIDDKPVKVLKLNSRDTVYAAGKKLPEGIHTIEIIKRTESMVGQSDFLGFSIQAGKTLLPLPARPDRKIEFIGNSITCGYGNEGLSQGEGFKGATENNYLAFGAITARNLDAQYVAVAYSGIGVYRNFGGNRLNTMPEIYDRIIPSDSLRKWNFKNYIPHAIVVDLGTNDFYLGNKPDSAGFVNAYYTFINTLRQKNPQGKIFCVLGPMMDGVSWKLIKNYISSLVKNYNIKGDKDIFYFTLTPCEGNGSDYHPTVDAHKKMAAELTPFLKSKMNW